MLTEQEQKRLDRLIELLSKGFRWQRTILLSEIKQLLKKVEVQKEV